MFDGSARAALPVYVEGRPGAAWFHKGAARVVFDFTVQGGRVTRIVFRAAPEVIATVTRRRPGEAAGAPADRDVTSEPRHTSGQ